MISEYGADTVAGLHMVNKTLCLCIMSTMYVEVYELDSFEFCGENLLLRNPYRTRHLYFPKITKLNT